MYTDLIIRIKNAQAVGKKYVRVPYSKMDRAVAGLLERKGFVKKVEVKGRLPKRVLKIYLDSKKSVSGLRFLSKPSLKRYSGYRDLKPVKGGHGVLIISTPEGILTSEEAKRKKVGGKLLVEVW